MNSINDKYDIDSYRSFMKLDEGTRRKILRSIFYAIKHPYIISGFSWDPQLIDGATQYLLKEGIIRYPIGARCIRNAVLCDGYVINGNYELEG